MYCTIVVCDGWILWGKGHRRTSNALEKKGTPELAFRHSRADGAKLEKVWLDWLLVGYWAVN